VLIVEAERFAGCGDDVVRSRSVFGRESIRRKPPKIVGWVARSKTQHQHTNTLEMLGFMLQPNLPRWKACYFWTVKDVQMLDY
jgi:hypothetical protein